MKQVLAIVCGIVTGFHLYAEVKPKAEIHLRITCDLPKLRWHPPVGYSGVITVTNTGEIAFTVVTDENWSDANRFYQEGDSEWQRQYNESEMGKQRRDKDREWAKKLYAGVIQQYPDSAKVLQPGESFSFEHKNIIFGITPSMPSGVCKAEMYLGHDTWEPVHITPTIYRLTAMPLSKGQKEASFYYSKEGANQYLYVNTGEKLKRVSEIKLDSIPEKEKESDVVTFELPDGTRKKLTHAEARQIIQEREQQNN